jgi:hypothetical protein
MKIKIADKIIFVEEDKEILPYWTYKEHPIEETKDMIVRFFNRVSKTAVINGGSDNEAQFMDGINVSFTDMEDELINSITKAEKIKYYCIIYEIMNNTINTLEAAKTKKTFINLNDLEEYEKNNKDDAGEKIDEVKECFNKTKERIISLLPNNLEVRFYVNNKTFYVERKDNELNFTIRTK